MVRNWGVANRVLFNADKIQLLPISLSDGPDFEVMFEDVHLLPSPSINLLGVRISSDLSWRPHIQNLVASASRKLGALFRVRRYFTSSQLLKIYKACIRPCLEYCSHVWGRLALGLVARGRRAESQKAISGPINCLMHSTPFILAAGFLLSLFYRYFHGRCSNEIRACVPPLARRRYRTRRKRLAHPYTVQVPRSRISRNE